MAPPPQTAFGQKLGVIHELDNYVASASQLLNEVKVQYRSFGEIRKSEKNLADGVLDWYEKTLPNLEIHRHAVDDEFRRQAIRIKQSQKKIDKARTEGEKIGDLMGGYRGEIHLQEQLKKAQQSMNDLVEELGGKAIQTKDWMPDDDDDEAKKYLHAILPLSSDEIGYTHEQLAKALISTHKSMERANAKSTKDIKQLEAKIVELEDSLNHAGVSVDEAENKCKTLENYRRLHEKSSTDLRQLQLTHESFAARMNASEETLRTDIAKLQEERRQLRVKFSTLPTQALIGQLEYIAKKKDEEIKSIKLENEEKEAHLRMQIEELQDKVSELHLIDQQATERFKREHQRREDTVRNAQQTLNRAAADSAGKRAKLLERLEIAKKSLKQADEELARMNKSNEELEEMTELLKEEKEKSAGLESHITLIQGNDMARDKTWLLLVLDLFKEDPALPHTILTIDRIGYILNAFGYDPEEFNVVTPLPLPPYRLNLVDSFSQATEEQQSAILTPISNLLKAIDLNESNNELFTGKNIDDLILCQSGVFFAAPEGNAFAHYPLLFYHLLSVVNKDFKTKQGLRAFFGINMLTHLCCIAPRIPQVVMDTVAVFVEDFLYSGYVWQQCVIKLFHSIWLRDPSFVDTFNEALQNRVMLYNPEIDLIDLFWQQKGTEEAKFVKMTRDKSFTNTCTMTIIRDMEAGGILHDTELIFVKNEDMVVFVQQELVAVNIMRKGLFRPDTYLIWDEKSPFIRMDPPMEEPFLYHYMIAFNAKLLMKGKIMDRSDAIGMP